MTLIRITGASLLLGAWALTGNAAAQSVSSYLDGLSRAAASPAAGGATFSAERGRTLFESRHGGDWSCSSCHTADPRAEGKHVVTGKKIAPLAPSANPTRFVDAAKADKWFRRNCNDVLKRECSALEKGDILTYLATLRS